MSGVKDGLEKLLEAEANFVGMWEQFKNELNAIERSCIARYNEKQKEKEMPHRLDSLLSVESAQPGSFTKEISEVKSQLELVDTEKCREALIRARAERLWAGEMPTKRSLGDEKRYAAKNEIHEIQYGNVITRDKALIERAFFEHYQNLLGVEREIGDGFVTRVLPLTPKLDEEVKAGLEVPISAREIEKAIDEWHLGKSPGPDGLSAAFL